MIKWRVFSWGCTPWEIQISICLNLSLENFRDYFDAFDWFEDFKSFCDGECENLEAIQKCRECWKSAIKRYSFNLENSLSKSGVLLDHGLVLQCIGKSPKPSNSSDWIMISANQNDTFLFFHFRNILFKSICKWSINCCQKWLEKFEFWNFWNFTSEKTIENMVGIGGQLAMQTEIFQFQKCFLLVQ